MKTSIRAVSGDLFSWTSQPPRKIAVDESAPAAKSIMTCPWSGDVAGCPTGAEPDVLCGENRLLVRRSHTQGSEIMKTTKQKQRYAIALPVDAMAILRRQHVDTQVRTEDQKRSELLFPSLSGSFRTQKVLNAPLAHVAAQLGMTKTITQWGLRRTFNDLARAAEVNDVVTGRSRVT